jgi:D-sedoheptulose 7-phosphate isomerase
VRAIELARQVGAKVFGIVGRDGGFTAASADVCVVIPPLFGERITPHTEGLCAVVWHLLVSHPALQQQSTRWEELAEKVPDAATAPRVPSELLALSRESV